MFTPEQRGRLRDLLLAAAHADVRITGAAVTGSAAIDQEDRWSDIDLALCVAADADYGEVIAGWTNDMYATHGALDHMDVTAGHALYRVFLLSSTLQVDLAFWPETEFGPTGPKFRLVFGAANELPPVPGPLATELIGLGWLHALHARSSIGRGRAWQAEYMISAVRDHVLALACLRHGLPVVQGRGVDRLPPEATGAVSKTLVGSLEPAELKRAFGAVTEALLREVQQVDSRLADRLAGPVREFSSWL